MDLDSRSPYGERQSAKRLPQITSLFRFTLPVWGATREKPAIPLIQAILIPAPCTGSNLGDFPLELCQQI